MVGFAGLRCGPVLDLIASILLQPLHKNHHNFQISFYFHFFFGGSCEANRFTITCAWRDNCITGGGALHTQFDKYWGSPESFKISVVGSHTCRFSMQLLQQCTWAVGVQFGSTIHSQWGRIHACVSMNCCAMDTEAYRKRSSGPFYGERFQGSWLRV